MVLTRWPPEEELGEHYLTWLKMMIYYVVMLHYFDQEQWFLDLEKDAMTASCEHDGIHDMVVFAETFYHGLPHYNFELYMVVCAYFQGII